jgi:type VI secretion system protein ImpM
VSGTTVTSILPPLAGFFGKLPGRGDFIGRHLPKAFVAPWDAWLQAAIAKSRTQMGEEAWRECYCTSPIWRFALGPGLCGPAGHAGILMPSVDRVGRYYPLIIAAPLAPGGSLLALPVAGEIWFWQAEQIALAGLDQDELDLNDFSQHVEALGAPPATDIAEDDLVAGNAWHCPLPEIRMLAQATPALAGHLLRRAFPQPSLWWTEGSDRIARCLLICDGLPPIDGFAALLAGDWEQRGWNEKSLPGIDLQSEGPLATEEDQP